MVGLLGADHLLICEADPRNQIRWKATSSDGNWAAHCARAIATAIGEAAAPAQHGPLQAALAASGRPPARRCLITTCRPAERRANSPCPGP